MCGEDSDVAVGDLKAIDGLNIPDGLKGDENRWFKDKWRVLDPSSMDWMAHWVETCHWKA